VLHVPDLRRAFCATYIRPAELPLMLQGISLPRAIQFRRSVETTPGQFGSDLGACSQPPRCQTRCQALLRLRRWPALETPGTTERLSETL
jgi:hypothetical protein